MPRGWFHAVRSVTDSISLTWNFVHRTGVPAFLARLNTPRFKIDADIIDFFFAGAICGDMTDERLKRLPAHHFSPATLAASRRNVG